MTEQHDEFDGSWKDILETYFQDFIDMGMGDAPFMSSR
jgi:hypothetical protein